MLLAPRRFRELQQLLRADQDMLLDVMEQKSIDLPHLQKPEEVIKPIIPDGVVPKLIKRLYGFDVINYKELDSFDDRNYHVTVRNQFANPNVREICGHGYVLKILNKNDSGRPLLLDAQMSLLDHIKGRSVTVPEAVLSISGQKASLENICFPSSKGHNGDGIVLGPYAVYLLKYIPGTILAECSLVQATLYNLGRLVGNFQNSMKDFYHRYYDKHTSLWSLLEIAKLSEFMFAVPEKNKGEIVLEVIKAFQHEVVPKFGLMQKGIIHGDLNANNILVKELPGQDNIPPEKKAYDISGLLDFSDVTKSYCVFDIAICIAHLSMTRKGVDDIGGYILKGVLKTFKLNSTELGALKILICGRLCQLMVLGAFSFHQDPNNLYILQVTKDAWPLLSAYWNTPNSTLLDRWGITTDFINTLNLPVLNS